MAPLLFRVLLFSVLSLLFAAANAHTPGGAEEQQDSDNLVVLSDDNFDQIVDGSKNVFVKFYAPWCGHCKTLAPIWNQLAEAYAAEEGLIIAKLDATVHTKTAEKVGVKGYPSLKLYRKQTVPEDYNGRRDIHALTGYLNAELGYARSSSGEIDRTTGRSLPAEGIIRKVACKGKTVEHCAQACLAAVEADRSMESQPNELKVKQFNYYKSALKKMSSQGYDFLNKEVPRLEKIRKSSSVSSDVRYFAVARTNILIQLGQLMDLQLKQDFVPEEEAKESKEEKKEEL